MKPIFQISGKKVELLQKKDLPQFKMETRPGGFFIATDSSGSRHRFFVRQAQGILSAHINGMTFRGTITEPQYEGASVSASESDLEAQFPGKIAKVHIQAGAKVSAGDPLVVLVAMKMEFVIRAPKDGIIDSVFVKEGDQVHVGKRFLSFTPAKPVEGKKS
jgi:3-methylcrotonyl-CoA carboxylase alpha subunit